MATKHRIKSQPGPFWLAWIGNKKHEVRKFDRKYEISDVVELYEFDPDKPEDKRVTGRELIVRITDITDPGSWGLPEDVGVFSFEELAKVDAPLSGQNDIPF